MVSLAVRTINPRQTVIVSCRGSANIFGKVHHLDELYPVDWHTPVSNNHLLYAVVIPKSHHVSEIINSSKVFAINFVSFDTKESVIRIRKHLGDIIDKFLLAGFTPVECEKIDCCRIQEAVGFFECELHQVIDAIDHLIFIGKVVNSEFKNDSKRLFHIDADEYTTTMK